MYQIQQVAHTNKIIIEENHYNYSKCLISEKNLHNYTTYSITTVLKFIKYGKCKK